MTFNLSGESLGETVWEAAALKPTARIASTYHAVTPPVKPKPLFSSQTQGESMNETDEGVARIKQLASDVTHETDL